MTNKKQIKFFILFSFINITLFIRIQAQVCCPNTNREVNSSLEKGTFTPSFSFPDNVLSPYDNAVNFNSAIGEDYLGWLVTSTSYFDYDVIEDATKAIADKRFIYIGYPNGVGINNYCLTNKMQFSIVGNQANCDSLTVSKKLLPSHQYRVSFDWIPFDKFNPNGTTETTTPHAEYWYEPTTSLIPILLFNQDGTPVNPKFGLAWANINNKSWKRVYGSFTIPADAPISTDLLRLYFSHLNSDNSGMLIDNMELVEVGITDAGLGALSCSNNATPLNTNDDSISFILNPTGSVGAYLHSSYKVEVAPDYLITPSTGVYGQNTTFTLSKNNISATGNITITIRDLVNTDCAITVSLPEPICSPCTSLMPSLSLNSSAGTCTGATPNENAIIDFSNIANSDRVGVSEGNTYLGTTFNSATLIPNTGIISFNGLKHNTNYTFRFFNGQDFCFLDTIITTPNISCCTSLSVSGNTTQPDCDVDNGAITLIVTGNSNPTPTFLWSNGATTQNIDNLSDGNYFVTLDDLGCIAITSFTLTKKPTHIIEEYCPGETVSLFILDTSLTDIQWYKDGLPIHGANDYTLLVTTAGTYAYTSNGIGGCAIGQCCPTEVRLRQNCCKPTICTGVKVTRKN